MMCREAHSPRRPPFVATSSFLYLTTPQLSPVYFLVSLIFPSRLFQTTSRPFSVSPKFWWFQLGLRVNPLTRHVQSSGWGVRSPAISLATPHRLDAGCVLYSCSAQSEGGGCIAPPIALTRRIGSTPAVRSTRVEQGLTPFCFPISPYIATHSAERFVYMFSFFSFRLFQTYGLTRMHQTNSLMYISKANLLMALTKYLQGNFIYIYIYVYICICIYI